MAHRTHSGISPFVKDINSHNEHINTMSCTTKRRYHDDIDERKKSKRSNSPCRIAAATGSLPPPDNDAAATSNNKNNKRPKRSHNITTTTTTTKRTIKVCLISIFGVNNDEEEDDSSINSNKKFVDIEVLNFDNDDTNDYSITRIKKLRRALAKLKKQACRAFGFSITSMMFRLLMYDEHEQIIDINENNITTIKPNDIIFIQSSFASSSSLVSSSIPPPSSMVFPGEAQDDDDDDDNGIGNKENDSSQSTTNSTSEFKPPSSTKDHNEVGDSKTTVKKRKLQRRSKSQDSRNDKTSSSSSNHNAVDDSTVKVKRFDKKQKISKSQASINDMNSIPSASLPSSSNHNDGEVNSTVPKRKEKKQKRISPSSTSQNNEKKSSLTTSVMIDLTTEEEGDQQNKGNNNNAKHSLSRTSPPPAKHSFSRRTTTTTTTTTTVQQQKGATSQPASMRSKREDAKLISKSYPGQKSLSYDSPSSKMHYQQTIQREEKVSPSDTLQQTKHHNSEQQQQIAPLFGTFIQNDGYENFLLNDDTDRHLLNNMLHVQTTTTTTTRQRPQISPSPATAQRIASSTRSSKNHQQQVPFGKFQHGTDIYRNKIGPDESNLDGHYSIQELVQPYCISGFCTTFGSNGQEYMNEIFGSTVSSLLVVAPAAYYTQSNDERLGDNNKNKKIEIGNGILVPMEFNAHDRQWHWLYTDVHTGACLHSKLSLFRCHQGLRVIVSGNNLCKHQQERQRDVFWVQDFPIYTTEMLLKKQQQEFEQGYESTDSNGSRVASKSSSTINTFEKQLRSFVQDIASCSSHADKQVVDDRINNTMFNNIDFSNHQAELVISFPRHGGYRKNKKIECGGYRHLATAVGNAITKLKRPTFRPSGSSVLYCTSGSMGDLKPNFIKQMHYAMLGITMNVEYHENSKTQWSDVHRTFRCLWPSVDMAMKMDLKGLCSLRPMPAEAYQEIHLWSPRSFHKVFHEATPNPPNTTFNYRLPKTGYSSEEEDNDHGNNEKPFHPATHGKFMWNNSGILYVGSHNFSVTAWGVSNSMPKNVELGVILVSDDERQHKKWVQRLPCQLVAPNAVSPDTYKAYAGFGAIHKEGRYHPLEPPMAICVGNDDLLENPVAIRGGKDIKQKMIEKKKHRGDI